MPDIVAREIHSHRRENVKSAVAEARAAMTKLHRLAKLHSTEADPVESFGINDLSMQAAARFSDQFDKFMRRHSGSLLSLNDQPSHVGSRLFDMYFNGVAPFETSKGKKHEFPDAASLLMLEAHAIKAGKRVVAASADEGWHAFASSSSHVYCLKSIGELAALFQSNNAEAHAIRDALQRYAASSQAKSDFDMRAKLHAEISSSAWDCLIPYSWPRFDNAEVVGVRMDEFALDVDSIGVWLTSSDAKECAAEIGVDCLLKFEVALFRGARPRGLIDVMTRDQSLINVERSVNFKLALELRGTDLHTDVRGAIARTSVVRGDYVLQISRNEMPRELHWDDLDDDVPF